MPTTTIARIRKDWKPGKPDSEKYEKLLHEEGPEGVYELRPQQNGYSVYFDRRLTRERQNPSTEATILVLNEECTQHTEIFFDLHMREIVRRDHFTDWRPVKDHKDLPTDFRVVAAHAR